MEALHTENLKITENATKESIGVASLHHPSKEECVKSLGFNPLTLLPFKTKKDKYIMSNF